MIPEDVVAAVGPNDPNGRGLRGPLKKFPHSANHRVAFNQRDLLRFPVSAVTGGASKRFNDVVALRRT